MHRFSTLFLSLIIALAPCVSYATLSIANHHEDALIPRSLLFSDSDYSSVQISPDGKKIAYLSPHNGVLNVWAGELKDKEHIKPVTHNTKRGVSSYHWGYNNEQIIYLDDEGGNENWRIHKTDIKTAKSTTLVGLDKVQIRYLADSPDSPDEILIGINQRKPAFHDVYRLNTKTGSKTLVYENNAFFRFIPDSNLHIKIALENTSDGGTNVYQLDNYFKPKKLFKIENEDILTTNPIALDKQAEVLYLIDSRKNDMGSLVGMNLFTKKINQIAQAKQGEISDTLFHPKTKTLQGYAINYTKSKWTFLDKTIQRDMAMLQSEAKSNLEIMSKNLDDKHWIIAYYSDIAPLQYYYFDRTTQKKHFLFSAKPQLAGLNLNKMQAVIIPTRDKMNLVSYLSLPNTIEQENGKLKKPVPLVLLIHGGPNMRDKWGYSATHQWLTNRGYAVLSVNFRGSTGFGKKFANAGNSEWGRKMQNDLSDAVDWAIKSGITTQGKIAIMGKSYGGYAALMGMAKTPDTFACGIDSVGISNLQTFMTSIPTYWKPYYARMTKLLGGDPSTIQGRAFLASRSPISFVKNIKKPVLIEQGAKDPRVKQAESEQIVAAMKDNHIPVTYILYPDEGHGFKRPENKISSIAVEEAFLAKHLGGKLEPIQNFHNSSIIIKIGGEYIKILSR